MTTLTTTSRRRRPAGHLLAIDRGLDLHLLVHAGQGEHLADCFRHTFARLPRSTANLLLSYWADGPCHLTRRPVLELHAALRPGIEVRREVQGLIYGVTDENGHRIRFAATVTDRMPPGVLEVLIAHELTHCEQRARLPAEISRWIDLEAHGIRGRTLESGGRGQRRLTGKGREPQLDGFDAAELAEQQRQVAAEEAARQRARYQQARTVTAADYERSRRCPQMYGRLDPPRGGTAARNPQLFQDDHRPLCGGGNPWLR
jgi:hypothetical protein